MFNIFRLSTFPSLKRRRLNGESNTKMAVNESRVRRQFVLSFSFSPLGSFNRRVFVLRHTDTRASFPPPVHPPPALSSTFFPLFLRPFERETAPRASRCFICLSALFITCNLALARARVISYWFSASPLIPPPPSSSSEEGSLCSTSSSTCCSSSTFFYPFLLLFSSSRARLAKPVTR